MILVCTQCQRLYDASATEVGTAVACECGDVLLIPDFETTEGKMLVENYMKRLATEESLKPEAIGRGDSWELQRGSARILVKYDSSAESLTIESSILSLPKDSTQRMRLFENILELNYRSSGEAHFATNTDQVVVTFTRSTTGLDYVEFHRAIESVCRTADDYDDELRRQFLGISTEEENDKEIDLSKLR